MTRRPGPGRLLVPVAVALLALLGLAAPVTADTCACDPIQPFLVTDGFNETHVVYRHATNPGIIYASNKTESWVKRRLTSAKDEPFAIAVDARQKAYIVFLRERGDEVHFHLLTNRSGEWVRTRLSTIQDDAYRVKVAIDPARKIHLAWSRDEQAWYATNASGTWTRRRLDNAMGNNTQLDLDAAGNVHLLYNQCTNDGSGTCDGAGIWYETNATGAWVAERISTDQQDYPEDIRVDQDGRVHLAFSREYNSQAQPDLPLGTYYMTNRSGTWTTTRVAPPGRMVTIERSRSGVITIVYTRVDDGSERRGIYLVTNASGSWDRSTVVREWALYPTTGISASGVLHLAYMRMAIDPGIYYSNNRGGDWSRRELMD